MRNKRAVSAVVATVLIILITIAAVTILWAAVIPMIKEKISGGTLCLDAVSQVTLITDQGYTCISDGILKIQVGRGPKDFELADIQVLVSAGGDTISFLVADATSGSLPDHNEERVLTFATTITDIDKVEIAPIVKVGNTEKACEICATAETLPACAV